jgi:probable rRNA maturation factor
MTPSANSATGWKRPSAAEASPVHRLVDISLAPAIMSAPLHPLTLSLQFADARHRDQLPRHSVMRWIRHALEAPGEITVRIVDEEEGRALNHDYRKKDYATNVLTFDYVHEPVVQADLILCAPVVAKEARELRIPVAHHYAHLLVHGTLHAQGYDHEDDGPEAEAMEARETEILTAMGFKDPYRKRRGQ